MQSAECKMQSAKCKVAKLQRRKMQSSKCKVQSAKTESAKFKVQIAKRKSCGTHITTRPSLSVRESPKLAPREHRIRITGNMSGGGAKRFLFRDFESGYLSERASCKTSSEPAELRMLRRRYCSDLLQNQRNASKRAPSRPN